METFVWTHRWPPVKVDEETRPVVEALQDLRGWIHEEAVDRLVSSVRNTESKSSRQLSFLDGNIGVYTVSLLCSPILLTPDEQVCDIFQWGIFFRCRSLLLLL